MTVYCAIPPLDQAATRVGRGYGLGWNRAHTRMDQMHGGFDFVADASTPILAPLPGTVALVSHDTGPGYLRSMRGYGNAVVVRHPFAVPGLPTPFFTLFAHMREPPPVTVGDVVQTGTLLGHVGNTTNGQFVGMGAHLHFEVRREPVVAYGSRRDTFDPAILWRAIGFDWLGARREAERMVGGQLLVREGGPSDCRAGLQPTVSALGRMRLGALPGYIDPSTLRAVYAQHGSSQLAANRNAPEPPDYKLVLPVVKESPAPVLPWVIGGGAVVVLLGGVLWVAARRS